MIENIGNLSIKVSDFPAMHHIYDGDSRIGVFFCAGDGKLTYASCKDKSAICVLILTYGTHKMFYIGDDYD